MIKRYMAFSESRFILGMSVEHLFARLDLEAHRGRPGPWQVQWQWFDNSNRHPVGKVHFYGTITSKVS